MTVPSAVGRPADEHEFEPLQIGGLLEQLLDLSFDGKNSTAFLAFASTFATKSLLQIVQHLHRLGVLLVFTAIRDLRRRQKGNNTVQHDGARTL